MDRLIGRAVESYLKSTYGAGLAGRVAELRLLSPPVGAHAEFRPLLAAAARMLGKPLSEMLDDMGAWLTRLEPIRRMLRFSGRDFHDFLLSLEELPGRAQMLLPDLHIPRLRSRAEPGSVTIRLLEPDEDWPDLLAGIIRGMADDYGALCLITTGPDMVQVEIPDGRFAQGRAFNLRAVSARVQEARAP